MRSCEKISSPLDGNDCRKTSLPGDGLCRGAALNTGPTIKILVDFQDREKLMETRRYQLQKECIINRAVWQAPSRGGKEGKGRGAGTWGTPSFWSEQTASTKCSCSCQESERCLTSRTILHFPGRDKWVRSRGIQNVQESETICMQSTTDSHIPTHPQHFPILALVPHGPLRQSRLIWKRQILGEVFQNSRKFKNARNCNDPNISFPFSIALREAAETLSTEVWESSSPTENVLRKIVYLQVSSFFWLIKQVSQFHHILR